MWDLAREEMWDLAREEVWDYLAQEEVLLDLAREEMWDLAREELWGERRESLDHRNRYRFVSFRPFRNLRLPMLSSGHSR